MPGADFLSGGFSFSTVVQANASETDIYIFGGMCPTSAATASTWQSAASYSNHMLKLSPSSSSAYTLDLADSRGPPIAEAGFTVTGLDPTYSNGSGVITQVQNFVLVGGHTQLAFINMSTVAIWSLPQETWAFQNVDSPSSTNPNTELAVKSTVTSVDSRSGHTAVLTEDGSKIIVLGGWVGDLSQAADPQLAVLNVAAGFGGPGDWSWSVPNEQPPGAGIYGHGAVMLPGDIMMVLGGYNISSSTSSKRDTSHGTQVQFFNTTSMSWMSNYTNPAYVAATSKSGNSSSSSSVSNAEKIGLGAGLGIGLAAILGALMLYFWYSRRLKRRRNEEREKTINSLSRGAANYYFPTTEMDQTGGGFPWSNGRWNRNGGNEDGHFQDPTSTVAVYENLKAGVHGLGGGGIPPPPRQIQRKPLKARNARGLYQLTPNLEYSTAGTHVRANSLGTAGLIHPIYEADEDDHVVPPIDTEFGIALGDPSSAPGASNRHSDPFKDPPTITYSSSVRRDNRSIMTNETENPALSREREIQEWVSDWAAADALVQSQAKSHSHAGRLSPTRRAQLIAASNVSSVSGEEDSGRTASNLSERSVAASALTVSRSGSSSPGRSRSNSLRGFITNAMNPFTSTILSTTVASTTVTPVFDVPGRSKNNKPPGSSGSGSSSFTTAHSSFPALRVEGETLLPRPDEFASGENSPAHSLPDSTGSPSKSKTPALAKARQMGWLSSLRLGLFRGAESESGNNNLSSHLLESREASPVRIGASGSPPRRTVSAGATLWRRKQGKGDWEDSADFNPRAPRSNTFTGDAPMLGLGSVSGVGDDDDDEWDIEQAVQNRVVQVMFTVPKEKLRVVNHNVEDDKSEIGSLRSKKGSNKSLRAVNSGPSLEPVGATETPITPESKGKKKGKVLEMVEKMEEGSKGNSPAR